MQMPSVNKNYNNAIKTFIWKLIIIKEKKYMKNLQFSSVHFSLSVVSDSLQPHEI